MAFATFYLTCLYILLGCGLNLYYLRQWELANMNRSGFVRFYVVVIRGLLLWPFFKKS